MNRTRGTSLVRLFPLLLACALGCHALHLDPLPGDRPPPDKDLSAPPGKHSFRVANFLFLYDFDLKRDLPLFRELGNLQNQVTKELQLPTSTKFVQVYVFEDQDHYEHFMRAKYPGLPKRRAFFVAQPHSVGGEEDMLVYTWWGLKLREDLRHELTHALLHSVLKDVPLWLDEGLAEYFEVPPENKGVNTRHLEQLRGGPGGPFKGDLARLEQLSEVQQMSPAEYREAWAWVHLMLADKAEGKRTLLAYLQQLRATPNPGPLGPRLAAVYPSLNEALDRHLAQLDAAKRPVPTAQR
jgi:hypothetical protein